MKLAGMAATALSAGGLPAIAGPFEPKDVIDHFVPADKKLKPEWIAGLFATGERTFYSGGDLETIGMPIGGLCAGQVYIAGDGRLTHWDIFNQRLFSGFGEKSYAPHRRPENPLKQGFALRIQADGKTVIRGLDGRGFPGVRFCGEYPIATVEYADQELPIWAALEAFSPFIPLNAADSALPATVMQFTLKNVSSAPIDATLAGWLENGVGRFSGKPVSCVRSNRVLKRDRFTLVLGNAQANDEPARSPRPFDAEADFGTMGLAILDSGDGVLASPLLPDGDLPEALFAGQRLAAATESERPFGKPACGAVGKSVRLEPGGSARITFIVGWCFPNRPELQGTKFPNWPKYKNFYATRFQDAAAVVEYIAADFDRLAGQTRLWHDTWYDSTLPRWLLDRLFSTVSTLATGTCQWWSNGRFWAWEGVGCCEGTCGHVWNYEHAMARLFPQLERSVREMQDFAGGFVDTTGKIRFRGEVGFWAGDAQAGYVLKAYREHLMSADDAFLKRNWPKIRQSLEFLIEQDSNADGLLEGQQHNTYDRNFFGPNTMVGSLYLAALRAAEVMANEIGDAAFARTCRRVFESGSQLSVERLFSGEYFIQQVDLVKHPKHQYADGCLADQLFGQGWAHQVGLGYIYPAGKVASALRAIWKYNWTPDVGPQNKAHPPQRWFAYPGEAGLFTCTWPKSKHLGPESVLYRDEVWTGIEYQVAGHMVWEGMLTEALAICRAVHERYHPSKHNPWNEVECGDHYARAMAGYGMFLALCGFECHGPKGRLGFDPRMTPENFRAAFTSAEGWGTFLQERDNKSQTNRVEVKWGRLVLRTLSLRTPPQVQLREALVTTAGSRVQATFSVQGERVAITPAEPLAIEQGQFVQVELTW